jgi:hypothetical protein
VSPKKRRRKMREDSKVYDLTGRLQRAMYEIGKSVGEERVEKRAGAT